MRKILSLCVVLAMFILPAFSQTKIVTGKVTDAQGLPVPFASVKLKGSNIGVATDANGIFTIKAEPGQTLLISGTNITSKSVQIGNANSYNINVTNNTATLNEVVVTALGVRRQSKELGYATTSIRTAQLNEAAVVNPATGLAGKVAGVDIRLADNGINPQVKVTFRGNRSLEGNNSALVIVDGVPVDQTYLANLNPTDIEDVSILKGSNAAALYGMAASNGVMIISTKKAKNKFTLTYSNTVSLESISYFPNLQNEYSGYGGEPPGAQPDPANASGVIYFVDPFTGLPNTVPFENESYGAAYSSLDFTTDSVPIGVNANGQWIYGPYKAAPNGRKDFFQTGIGDQNKLSGSFGGKHGGLYFSGEHTTKQGVIPTETYARSGARLNGNLNFGRFTVSAGINYTNVQTNSVGYSYDQYRPVYWNVMNQLPNIDLASVSNTNLFQNNQGFGNAYFPNPWVQVHDSRSKTNTNELISNLQLNYKFADWLNISAKLGYSRTWANDPAYIDSISFPSWLGNGGLWGEGSLATTPGNQKYQYEDITDHYDDLNGDLFLTATKQTNHFKFTLIAGTNMRNRNSFGNWYSNQVNEGAYLGTNYIPATYTKVTNADGSANATYSYKRFDQSVYADLVIGYDDWLFLHGSFRNDWTSILDPQNRSFHYPAVDLSAVLSDKVDAIKNSNSISFLKIRLGYAGTGNVSIDGYQHLGALGTINGGTNSGSYSVGIPTFGAYAINPITTVGTGFPFATGGNSYSQTYNTVQPGLKPEHTNSIEAGINIGFLKNRVNFEANYYSQVSTNQTFPLQASNASGLQSYLVNGGTMDNSGLELELNLTPLIKAGDFRFNIGINFSYLNTKVKSISGGAAELDIINTAGGNVGGIYAIQGQPYPEIKTTDFNRDVNGKVIVDPGTGLPSFNPTPVNAGNTNYKYIMGTSPTFIYKNFSLRMVFDYRGGAKILNAAGAAMDFAGISSSDAANRYSFVVPNSVIGGSPTKAGTPNTNVAITSPYQNFPLAIFYWANFYNQIGMPYVTSAAFIKLREVSLGYEVPKKLFNSSNFIKGLSFNLIGRNLFMWRPKTNIWSDPEFSTNGQGNAVGYTTEYQTPPTRIISATISATIF